MVTDDEAADTARDEDARGVVMVLRAFEVLRRATASERLLATGKEALPVTETEARERALRIIEVLDEAGAGRPDRLVQIVIGAASPKPRLHVAPVYSMRIGTEPRVDAVVDPFLRPAPMPLADWKQALAADAVVFLFPEVLVAARDEALTAPMERVPRSPGDITTQRGGAGKPEDCHGLAQLLRAWLKQPDDPAQVGRFRDLFGELTWRAFQHAYPELLNEVEHALLRARRRP